MTDFHQDKHQKAWTAGLALVGVAMVTTGLILNPSDLAEYLNKNGIFGGGIVGRPTIALIFRWGLVSLGATALSCAIFKVPVDRLNRPRLLVTIVFALLALALLNKALNLALDDNPLDPVTGAEYSWIADGLKAGQGFSLPANHRWYFEHYDKVYPADEYYPTAIEEPIYPFLLAYAQRILGERGRLIILLVQLVALFLTGIIVYLISRKVFDSRLGIIASVALLTIWWHEVRWQTIGAFSPAALGGLNTTCSAFLLLWCLERISVKRSVLLGIMLAVSCLTLSAGMLFVPLAALLILVSKRPLKPLAWKPALAVLITVGAVVSPWMLRNYLVFGELVPIRTGFGLALHQSNPALAATFFDGSHTCVKELGPIWRAENAKDAINQVSTSLEKRGEMYLRSFYCIEHEAPPDYASFNEAQRDKVYLQKSVDFIKRYPRIFLTLSRFRLQSFFVGWNSRQTMVVILAFLGALLAWRNRKSFIMVSLVGAYVFPFLLLTPLKYRYRYPIEPILFVLASGVPIVTLSIIRALIRKTGILPPIAKDEDVS